MKLTIAVLAAASLVAAELPKHPRELKFPAVAFQPPKPSDYRHKLANGATAYLVPDRELPLVNLSVTVRTGSWLEPACAADSRQARGVCAAGAGRGDFGRACQAGGVDLRRGRGRRP